MPPKGYRFTEEQKQAFRKPKPGLIGNTNGVIHGLSRTREYNSWKKMMKRCYDTADPYYANYGERGITVDERWHEVRNFYADMVDRWGERSAGYSLERVNVDGDYELTNCCWIPMGAQSKNRTKWKHTPEGLEAIAQARRDSAK